MVKRKIFDAHCHIGKFGIQYMKGNSIEPFKGREVDSVKSMQEYMKKYNITKTLIVPHYTPEQSVPFKIYNPLVFDITSKLKNVYGGIWVSPLEENIKLTEEVLSKIPNPKIKVLKISPDSWPKGITPDPETWDNKFRKNILMLLETIKEYNLVLHTHTGSGNSDIMNYIPFIEKYGKDIKIQFVHMGGSAGGHFAFVPRFINWLKEDYDFYCDTSFCKGFGPNWLVNELIKKYPKGLDRVLFASDNPWGLFPSEYWRIEGIEVNNKIKNKIFYENADKLYCKNK